MKTFEELQLKEYNSKVQKRMETKETNFLEVCLHDGIAVKYKLIHKSHLKHTKKKLSAET